MVVKVGGMVSEPKFASKHPEPDNIWILVNIAFMWIQLVFCGL